MIESLVRNPRIAISLLIACGGSPSPTTPAKPVESAATPDATLATQPSKGPPGEPSCRTAIKHAIRFEDYGIEMDLGIGDSGQLLLSRCEADVWSIEARRCIGSIERWSDLERCGRLLTKEQMDRFESARSGQRVP